MLLVRFRATRPRFEITQERSLEWLARVHSEAEAALAPLDEPARARFEERLAAVIRRCGCSPDKIARRGHSLVELDSFALASDALYDAREHPHGRGTAARTRMFAEIVDAYFAAEYASERDAPGDLVHVTCTGYAAPNGAQKLVAARGWPTRVTNAYHMGCYAAVPALRIAQGFVAAHGGRVDIAHTELCSLHLDPADHAIERLVVQSLFADGLIRYSMVPEDDGHGLAVHAIHELVLPNTASAMTWAVADAGMQMTLARDVPGRIGETVRAFVVELFRIAGRDLAELATSVCAVHPGGPRIIDRVAEMLELRGDQVATSRAVLRDHGNMSSATLPHVWMRILADPAIRAGTLIPSLAFGPGLTMCGALLEKR